MIKIEYCKYFEGFDFNYQLVLDFRFLRDNPEFRFYDHCEHFCRALHNELYGKRWESGRGKGVGMLAVPERVGLNPHAHMVCQVPEFDMPKFEDVVEAVWQRKCRYHFRQPLWVEDPCTGKLVPDPTHRVVSNERGVCEWGRLPGPEDSARFVSYIFKKQGKDPLYWLSGLSDEPASYRFFNSYPGETARDL